MTEQQKLSADKIVRGACPLDCPDTCSWEVTVKEGRAVALRGTRDHPYTRGSLCAKMNKYLDHVYAPDRLLYPMRRIGEKGEGRFERITWDDALGEIAERLKNIIAQYGGQAILPYVGTGNMGFLQGEAGVGQRLWNTLGASIHSGNICSRAGSVGTIYTMGSRNGMDPEECRHSKLILLWGTNPLTSHNHIWRFITEARAQGAYIVVIDPTRTRTAEQADEYLSLIPGTDAALALGLLNVVVTLGAEDRAYIEKYTLGWGHYRERIAEYPPERVAQITGIPEEKIRVLGKRLATTRPTSILTKMGIQRHAGGGMALRTIMTIPGVTGDWQYQGGGAIYSTGDYMQGNFDRLFRPDLRPPNTRALLMSRLGESLLEVENPPVKALLVLGANPVASNPDQNKVRRGLARDDLFTIVVDHFQTDTADYADLLLPTTMQPEHADILNAYGHLYVLRNEPAILPPGECLPSTEIVRRLARVMGLTDPCLYDSDEDLARAFLDTDHPSLQGITLEKLKEQGWTRLNYPSPAIAYPHGFPTPSGKIEFYSRKAADDGFDPLPTHTPSQEVEDQDLARRYPLTLITPASHYFLNSIFANKPDLAKQAGPMRVALHPQDAALRTLSNGDTARIFNARGEFHAVVAVSDAVRPGVAISPKGYWHKLNRDRANANVTVAERDSDMGGAVYHDNRVEVEKFTAAMIT
ncbi:thiosulfate reductase / polysulfide reductase chain A [Anaerolineae bacterium]|nr:thiosulfate reductase / polysulfide reductase chain A [Anaerolineae bacterium]